MKGIRRSLNKDRIGAPTGVVKTSGAGPAGGLPLGQRPMAAPAPAPPKLVIRATAAYRARGAQELSFNVGDFFHVVSDEGGEDWFDAANPMTGARGLVPASHFQVLGRNVRETNMQGPAKKSSTGSGSDGGSGPASPYGAPPAGRSGSVSSASGLQPGAPYVAGPSGMAAAHKASVSSQGSVGNGRPPSQSSRKHQPLYGVVQYDFIAERPDELDAKRGEPIIVIAQSNHEWFVAKPIGRLGGPGLIPVAFVEIQDMATGKPVENVEELIRSAVVPKVEEWKKMTADYKQASIPLGRFDFAEATTSSSNAAAAAPAVPSSSSSAPPPQQLQSAADVDPNPHYDQAYASPTGNALSPRQGGYDPRYSYTRERRQYGLVTSASVESFHQEEGSFWFHLRAFFSTGASLVLYRLYQDFYDFQIALMDEFPVEAGRVPGDDGHTERILPMMPGPTTSEDENVCSQRVIDLSIYLSDLCSLPEHIRASGLMYEFLVPRAGDVEVAPGHVGYDGAPDASPAPSQGIENQYGELVDYLDQLDSSAGGRSSSEQHGRGGYASGSATGTDVTDQMGHLSLNGGGQYGNGVYQRQSQQHVQQQQSEYDGAPLSPRSAPPLAERWLTVPLSVADRYNQSGYYEQPPQPAEPARQPMGTANQGAAFIKIKIFHRNTDDLIAIRVPPTVSLGALLDKVRDRLGSDVTQLRFREEGGGAGGSGAQLVGLRDDHELEHWVRSGAKLVLVRPVSALSLSSHASHSSALTCPCARSTLIELKRSRAEGQCGARLSDLQASLFVFLPLSLGSLRSQRMCAGLPGPPASVRRPVERATRELERLTSGSIAESGPSPRTRTESANDRQAAKTGKNSRPTARPPAGQKVRGECRAGSTLAALHSPLLVPARPSLPPQGLSLAATQRAQGTARSDDVRRFSSATRPPPAIDPRQHRREA